MASAARRSNPISLQGLFLTIQPHHCVVDLSVRQPVLILEHRCQSDYVVSKFAFMWTAWILCSNLFLATWTFVMSNLAFSYHDRLMFWDFLNDFGINSKRRTKLCPTIGTSIHSNFHLLIWSHKGSCYAFVLDLLTGFSLFVFIPIIFATASL